MVNRKLFRPTLTEVKEQFPARPIQAVPRKARNARSPRHRNRLTRKISIT